MLDFQLDALWGYENGEKWGRWADGRPDVVIRGDADGQPWDRDGGLETLASRLREERAEHVHLSFRGRIPLGSDDWLAALPLRSANGGIDRCFCRYVTRPRFLSLLPKPIRAPTVAYHFRTSLADVPDAQTSEPRECASAEAKRASVPSLWTEPVCGDGRNLRVDGYVMSDAPGLVAQLQALRPGLLANPLRNLDESGRVISRTRSWSFARAKGRANRSALLFLAADYLIGGLAAEVQETMASSFSRPLAARSVCVQDVGFVSAASGACPAFQTIFWRDMRESLDSNHRYFDVGDWREAYGCFREAIVDAHPCKELFSARECRQAFVAAVRAER